MIIFNMKYACLTFMSVTTLFCHLPYQRMLCCTSLFPSRIGSRDYFSRFLKECNVETDVKEIALFDLYIHNVSILLLKPQQLHVDSLT